MTFRADKLFLSAADPKVIESVPTNPHFLKDGQRLGTDHRVLQKSFNPCQAIAAVWLSLALQPPLIQNILGAPKGYTPKVAGQIKIVNHGTFLVRFTTSLIVFEEIK